MTTVERDTQQRGTDLHNICVREAVNEYLADRKGDVADATHRNLRYRLKRFREWAEEYEFDNMADLSGHHTNKYRLTRKTEHDVGPLTLRNQMRTFRHFVTWCEDFDYVKRGVSDTIRIQQVDEEDEVSDEILSHDRAEDILDNLRKYHYATRQHVLFSLLVHTGMRTGSGRAIDVGDWQRDDDGDAFLQIRHRPETDTPLKNTEGGERNVLIQQEGLVEAIDDYIADRRPDVSDDHDREPLLATRWGRASKGTLQTDVYALTSCRFVGECDDDCPAQNKEYASRCPLSVSPHALRKTFITDRLNEGMPKALIGGRANVSVDTLEKHYNKQTTEKAYQARKKHLKEWEGVESMQDFEEETA